MTLRGSDRLRSSELGQRPQLRLDLPPPRQRLDASSRLDEQHDRHAAQPRLHERAKIRRAASGEVPLENMVIRFGKN